VFAFSYYARVPVEEKLKEIFRLQLEDDSRSICLFSKFDDLIRGRKRKPLKSRCHEHAAIVWDSRITRIELRARWHLVVEKVTHVIDSRKKEEAVEVA
jgi:hypothetical protein